MKHSTIHLISLALLLLPVRIFSTSEIVGDVDGDGKVDIRDLVKIINHVKGEDQLSETLERFADSNGDGIINFDDLEPANETALGIKPIQYLPLTTWHSFSPADGEGT